jgi:AbiU2
MSSTPFGYVEEIPEQIRNVFMWLCQDLASLQRKWDFYLESFSITENAELLSDLAPTSFNIIFESLQCEITMAICRLSDPPSSMNQENLSLKTLILNYANNEKLNKLVDEFQTNCDPIRRLRNKRIGHIDFDTVIKPIENPLPGITKNQINNVLILAADILNQVLQIYKDSEMYFHPKGPGDSKVLLSLLRKSKEISQKI